MEIFKKLENFWVSNIGNVRTRSEFGRNRSLELTRTGYHRVRINGKHRLVHELVAIAFLGHVKGNLVVDHIDENKTNNKTSNLRLITFRKNKAQSCVGISGREGVSQLRDKWRARAYVDGVQHHIGTYKTIDKASNAYQNFIR